MDFSAVRAVTALEVLQLSLNYNMLSSYESAVRGPFRICSSKKPIAFAINVIKRRIYRMRILVAAMTFLLVAMTSGVIHAGERAGAFTVSPFLGGYTFDGAQSLETRPVFGVRLGYNFTKNIALEGTLSYLNTEFTNSIPGDIDVIIGRLEAVYNFMPDRNIVPYLAIGGGGTTLEMPTDPRVGHPHNHSPTINVGGGLKWFFSKDMALRADCHQNFLIDTSDSKNRVEDVIFNYEYSVGLQILFGGT
jgi:OmpA-OmpF porin, OOP family